ncbi:MAG TPA: DUF1549 and DUF1553 domain-containing protein [Verrucomicrobiales bacterium]|nr:DUF1549 and DUF1553 domain-containing protein [Verrucomicrobiales bacterium]
MEIPLALALILAVGPVAEAGDLADAAGGRDHWAFRPLAHTRPATSSDWSRSPIDDFVLTGLEAAGLKPGADADPLDLIRRLYLQLTGLPPDPAAVQAFVEDKGADAVERLVDHLLNSPQFGERWGRHWLDLARYADSNGLDENFLFREAWRYRNWVIDSVNADLSYDRLVLEQIAGDLLPFSSIEERDRKRIAAGFLVIGPKVLLGNDVERQRMEVADEQLDTIGRAFLGLTLGCARCHDHKFDPIPTADYYAMAGILTSTQVMEQRYMLGEQRVMERLAGLGEDGDVLDGIYEEYWRGLPKMKKTREQAGSLLELLKNGEATALEEFVANHPGAASAGAGDQAEPIEKRIEAQNGLIAELDAAISNPPPIPPRAMIPADADAPGDESIRRAGQFDRPGDKVARGFLGVVAAGVKPGIPEGSSGRMELGRWLTDVEAGAGRLTARVLANRIWLHLIGEGIVRTTDNFGRTGEEPSHPELLDYLARELIDSGWSVKSLVRKIALSRTFGLSSESDAEAYATDPDNRLLWRANRRRLEAEALRDAMLLSAGELDLTRMQSTVWYLGDQATAVGKNEVRRRTGFSCRSVYLPVIRNDLPELFDAFNFADPHATTGSRPRTNVATQGLFLLNDKMVIEAAEAAARRVLKDETSGGAAARVDKMFELILNCKPSEDERQRVLAFIQDAAGKNLPKQDEPDAEFRAWSMACHAMFSLSRFQYVE